MKILVFYQYFTTPKGAWSTRVYEFARRWVREGHEVTVVTSVYDKSDLEPEGLIDRVDVEGIDVRVINVKLSNKHGIGARLLSFAWYAVAASWYAVTLEADVVVASSGPITVGVPGLMARWIRSRKLVFEVRDLWPEGAIQLKKLNWPVWIFLARRFEAFCYRSSRVVVALSVGMMEDIKRRFPNSKVVVVPNSCDNELFSGGEVCAGADGIDLPADRRTAVYTGTLGTMDDCGQILDAAEVLVGRGRTDISFVLIGDGSEKESLEQRVSRDGLINVSFTGLMPKTDVVGWLRAATCALLVFRDVPVLATSSPNKLFDALAAGVPVIQNTDGWIQTMFESEQCGLSVRAGDRESLANAITRLCDDSALRERLAENARRVALDRYDRGKLAANMLDALSEACIE
jgi:glycosyltransferase involved in cell wall biosynthesis